MLTESEREWLNNRDNHAEHFCRWCDTWETCLGEFGAIFCPSWTQKVQLREAAEFEGRVSAKLANIHFGTEDCAYCSNHINVNEYCGECKTASTDKRCLACRIKYARQQVEEEMDGYNTM